MIQQEEHILEPLLQTTIKRRALLPIWIKIFIWIFMIIGPFAALALIAIPFNFYGQMSIYGMEANQPSFIYVLIGFIFIYKAVVAFGLWTEKDWAVMLGMIDAWFGIILCATVMFIFPILFPGEYGFKVRLELAVLIPYLLKLNKLNSVW